MGNCSVVDSDSVVLRWAFSISENLLGDAVVNLLTIHNMKMLKCQFHFKAVKCISVKAVVHIHNGVLLSH